MTKFEVKNRWTGNVQFTAEIDYLEGNLKAVRALDAFKPALEVAA